ncbi:MAG: ATP-binding cassette domain-containing protein [Solirubrobacterales bacterium]
MNAPAAIETDRLSKLYRGGHGIEDVTMTVDAGEVFGFLGPNGAGKTTTIRTLLDLIHPTGGAARIFGLDSRRDSVAIRRRIGNLPGDFGFGRETCGHRALDLIARLRAGPDLDRAMQLAERFRADLDRPLGELAWQPPEDRPDPRHLPSTRPAGPRRADRWCPASRSAPRPSSRAPSRSPSCSR